MNERWEREIDKQRSKMWKTEKEMALGQIGGMESKIDEKNEGTRERIEGTN